MQPCLHHPAPSARAPGRPGVQQRARLVARQPNAIAMTAGSALDAAKEALVGRKVAIFVEPSPFSHISGMKNRFESLIKGLREAGDDVMVVTPDPKPPREFCGAKVRARGAVERAREGPRACVNACIRLPGPHARWGPPGQLLSHRATPRRRRPRPADPVAALQVVNVLGFRLPFYQSTTLLLSLGLSVRVLWYLWRQRPDVIHVSTPGILCFAAVLYARLLAVPLVMSYHTHIPEYIPRYTWSGLVQPMWSIIRWCTRRADLTLVTSKAMKVGAAGRVAGFRFQRARASAWSRWHPVPRPPATCGPPTCGSASCCWRLARMSRFGRVLASENSPEACIFTASAASATPHRGPGPNPNVNCAPQTELERNHCRPKSIDVWQRGVDTEVFHPRHRSREMRARMTNGHPDAPLLVYVGRLGAGGLGGGVGGGGRCFWGCPSCAAQRAPGGMRRVWGAHAACTPAGRSHKPSCSSRATPNRRREEHFCAEARAGGAAQRAPGARWRWPPACRA